MMDIDVFILRETNLLGLANFKTIEALLQALANSKPYAIDIGNTGITDSLIMAVVNLFLHSAHLMYLGLEGLALGIDSFDALDKLVKTCPFIVCLPID
jgi:hypothetical protein